MTELRTVILLRHAKSSWKEPHLSDHDRPLNKRGRRSAPVIGTWLEQKGYFPDVILSSTSARTQETVARLNLSMDAQIRTEFISHLYHASPDTILETLRAVDQKHHCAMIVGHQPGLSSFAGMFSKRAEKHCVQAYEHIPTAAAAIFQTDVRTWDVLNYCSANFMDFAKSRDLMGE